MTLSAKHEAFNAHLDACERCAKQPFNLCATGARMLRDAVEEEQRDLHVGFVREAQHGGPDWEEGDDD